MERRLILSLILLFGIHLAGCGDSNSSRSPGEPPDQPDPDPPANTEEIDVELSFNQVVEGGAMSASGDGELVLNLDDGTLSGTVTLSGVDADSVVLNTGFAGEAGNLHTALEQDNSNEWALPGGTVLDEEEEELLRSGGLHILVTSQQNPDGALRGQILVGTVRLILTRLSGMQEVPPVETMATGRGFLTVDTSNGELVANVHTQGADDAQMGHIHQSPAGVNGGILIDLIQAGGDSGLWSTEEDATLDADSLDALSSGLLYYNIHTPANPAGEIRGQIEPEGIEVDFTVLTGDDVVIVGMEGVETEATATAATTLDTETAHVSVHLNTRNLSDASGASLNVAPEGQNGPVLAELNQDPDDTDHWLLEDFQLTEESLNDLRNQRLYFTVSNPMWPDGVIRGQWRPENSAPSDGESFRVTTVSPSNGAELDGFPGLIEVTFNRDVDGATADSDSVTLTASGGDGSFGDGNEVEQDPLVINTQDNTVAIDTTALEGMDDVYQVSLLGSGGNALTDAFGNTLDGDGNGEAGGDFISTFSVVADMQSNATFSFIQENVFTPNCTFSGCHSGPAPAAGQNLTEGQAYDNIVNVPSSEVPELLRIDPGNPDDSYLIRKVEGTASVGERMPLDMAPLSTETIQLMRQWVEEGAQNN